MPRYDFKCPKCGQQAEYEFSYEDIKAALKVGCTPCGAEMRRMLSTPAISFKGGGWACKG